MSAGAFTTVGYQATYNAAQVHPIRVQPETLALEVTIGGVVTTNTGEPIADVTNPISAVVSRGRRSKGLNARLIRITFGENPPADYRAFSTIALPAVNPALLAAPAGASGNYLGTEVTVAGTSPESIR